MVTNNPDEPESGPVVAWDEVPEFANDRPGDRYRRWLFQFEGHHLFVSDDHDRVIASGESLDYLGTASTFLDRKEDPK